MCEIWQLCRTFSGQDDENGIPLRSESGRGSHGGVRRKRPSLFITRKPGINMGLHRSLSNKLAREMEGSLTQFNTCRALVPLRTLSPSHAQGYSRSKSIFSHFIFWYFYFFWLEFLWVLINLVVWTLIKTEIYGECSWIMIKIHWNWNVLYWFYGLNLSLGLWDL